MDREKLQKAYGKIVAKAWSDEEFKVELFSEPAAVFKESDIEVPEGVELRMVENTDKVVYFISPPPPPWGGRSLHILPPPPPHADEQDDRWYLAQKTAQQPVGVTLRCWATTLRWLARELKQAPDKRPETFEECIEIFMAKPAKEAAEMTIYLIDQAADTWENLKKNIPD